MSNLRILADYVDSSSSYSNYTQHNNTESNNIWNALEVVLISTSIATGVGIVGLIYLYFHPQDASIDTEE